MTREEAISLLHDMKDTYDEIHENTNSDIGYEQMTALDMAIEALNNSVQMSNIQELQAENGFLKEMVKFYREQQTVEVVRCKDCIHYEKHDTWSACTYWSGNPYEQASVIDDDFCSYGERAEKTEYKLPGYDDIMEKLDELTLKGGGNNV